MQDKGRPGFLSRYARGFSRQAPPAPPQRREPPAPPAAPVQPAAPASRMNAPQGPARSGPSPLRPPPSQAVSGASAADTPAGREIVARKLSGFDRARIDWAQIHEYTLATLQETFAERRVAPESLRQPRLDITVPAIEAMRYSALKRELVLLIASTMDPDRSDEAHPAFVEILKQLTPDEAGLVARLPPAGQVIPMANLLHLDRQGHIRASLRRIIPQAYTRHCARPGSMPGYVDNLLRLNLVASPERLRIDDPSFYRSLMAQDHVSRHVSALPAHLEPSVERSVLTITDFGDRFRQCCLDSAGSGRAGELR